MHSQSLRPANTERPSEQYYVQKKSRKGAEHQLCHLIIFSDKHCHFHIYNQHWLGNLQPDVNGWQFQRKRSIVNTCDPSKRHKLSRAPCCSQWKPFDSPYSKHHEGNKMIRNSAETDTPRKQEGCDEDDKKAKGSYNLKTWAGLKDPRIVRVSRSFGGKDRHSKVRTIKGLRDRRVRLSVSTAIQLYDLQDRLGLNQPSKVVDWLIKAAQHEIDELPPLPIPQECDFNFQSSISNSDLEGDRYSGVQPLSLLSTKSRAMEGAAASDPNEKNICKLQFGSQGAALRSDQFRSEKEMINQEKSSSSKRYEQGSQSAPRLVHNSQTMNSFHLPHQPSYPSLLINAFSSNPYAQRDSRHFLPHLGAQTHSVQAHEDNSGRNNSAVSPLSLSSGSHLLYQPIQGQSSSPSFVTTPLELDHSRQLSHPQLLNMSLQSAQLTSPSSPFGNLGQSFRHAYGAITSNLHHYQQNISHSPDTSEKGKNV